MYKKYITNKTSYNKIRKNNLTSTSTDIDTSTTRVHPHEYTHTSTPTRVHPHECIHTSAPAPAPTSKQKIIITQTHTLSYSN